MKTIFEFLNGTVTVIFLMMYFPTLIAFMRDWNRPNLGKLFFLNTAILASLIVAGLVQLGLDHLSRILA